MTEINSKYKIGRYKNGLPHFGVVYFTLELNDSGLLEIEENYVYEEPIGFSQGQIESIPRNGYDDWKKGIHNGIEYAYSKLLNNNGLKVIIESANGLLTDTNPTIIGFTASRAILEKLPNLESNEERIILENMVYSSWCFDYNSIPDFKNRKIIGEEIKSRYRFGKETNIKSEKQFENSFWTRIKNLWAK